MNELQAQVENEKAILFGIADAGHLAANYKYMPLDNRVCFLPWQSRFIETHELILTVITAIKPKANNTLFMVRSDVKLNEQ